MRPQRITAQLQERLHNVDQHNVVVKRNLKKKLKPVVGPFAESVRALRESLGESQEGMARKLGVSLSGYKFWESGDRTPSAGWILKLRALCHDARTRALFGLEELDRKPPDPAPGRGARGSEAREELHIALDTILDRAPETVKEKITEMLTQSAGKYGRPK